MKSEVNSGEMRDPKTGGLTHFRKRITLPNGISASGLEVEEILDETAKNDQSREMERMVREALTPEQWKDLDLALHSYRELAAVTYERYLLVRFLIVAALHRGHKDPMRIAQDISRNGAVGILF